MLRIASQDCFREFDKDKESICTFAGVCEYWHYGGQNTDDRSTFPDLEEIQSILVSVGDKKPSFVKSHDWIGSVEVGTVIQNLTNTDYRIVQVPNGKFEKKHLEYIRNHFTYEGAPIMMGGSKDSSSKCILALKERLDSSSVSLLILDPHYYSTGNEKEPDLNYLWQEGWLKWCETDSLLETDFYNMCMPLAAYK